MVIRTDCVIRKLLICYNTFVIWIHSILYIYTQLTNTKVKKIDSSKYTCQQLHDHCFKLVKFIVQWSTFTTIKVATNMIIMSCN